MQKHDVTQVRQHANGQWHRILTANGMGACFLQNKNGPCPFCGGRDRWRWDNKNGDGGGYCHQCDAKGSGLNILALWLGLTGKNNFPTLLSKVADTVRGVHG